MHGLLRILLCAAFAAALNPAWAGEARPLAANPDIEARMHSLGEELRCLVCQNQSLADSHSGLADDLRREMREQMAAGKSDKEIVDFMVARYGDFVRYRPPLKATTLLLWLGPFALALVAVVALIRFFRTPSQENSS